MMTNDRTPRLIVNYSPKLDLRLSLVKIQGYGGKARADYCCELECQLRHPTGSFGYSANDLYFDLKAFERFSAELQGMQQGLTEEAALKDMGEMVVLRLEGNSRRLEATLDIKEYLAPKMAALNATLEVEYDLFVNKLSGAIERFIEDLRNVEPSSPERAET